MWTWVVGLFLVAHGLVHVAVWAAPVAKDQPFDPHHSWALEGAGVSTATVDSAARVMSIVSAVAFVVGGIALLAGVEVWRPITVVASVLGLAMAVVWFHPWFTVDVLINAGLLLGLTVWEWPTTAMVGV